IDIAPGCERIRHFIQAGPGRPAREDFKFEGLMEALFLALGLRVVRATMADGDTQTDEPGCEAGVRVGLLATPGSTVIHEHAFRQTVALEGAAEIQADSFSPLVGTGCETEVEAGMVIKHREGVAARFGRSEMALEVHLPEVVRPLMLEALQVPLQA